MIKAHIISHTHWDREWYLPYEHHHMKLVELLDGVLDRIENDPNFNSFHLDGQTIPIEDYLRVKPENTQRIHAAIAAKKLLIGPWYVLQDAFLTSAEANVRNMQIGSKQAEKLGFRNNVGYYPDTFGIYRQAPQILKLSEIDNLIFGRGVSATGFNNEVNASASDNEFASKFSEMMIEAPNGDQVLGILFANWYNNADGIPLDPKLAKIYWDKKLQDSQRYTSTGVLLFMNGCDHTPLQAEVSAAIAVANELYDDVEFIHSNFEAYLAEVKLSLPPVAPKQTALAIIDSTAKSSGFLALVDKFLGTNFAISSSKKAKNLNPFRNEKTLTVISGELKSQNTDGYNTLVNTASARVSLKQQNVITQDLFEKLAEPLSTMLRAKANYPHAQLEYGWKLLIENHPHDSICGCSVDAVHRKMAQRFADAQAVGQYLLEEALDEFKKNVRNDDPGIQFTLFNPLGDDCNKVHELIINLDKTVIDGDVQALYQTLMAQPLPFLALFNTEQPDGLPIQCELEDLGVNFIYELPKNSFRIRYFARQIKVRFMQPLTPLSWKTFALKMMDSEPTSSCIISSLKPTSALVQDAKNSTIYLENNKIQIEINQNLQIKITAHDQQYSQLIDFDLVDEGDIGNEYMFGIIKNDHYLQLDKSKITLQFIQNAFRQTCVIETELLLPIAAVNLEEEKRQLAHFSGRHAQRSTELVRMPIKICLSLDQDANHFDLQINYTNIAKDHRLKALFRPHNLVNTLEVDSIFDVVQRPLSPKSTWKNVYNDQHQSKFLSLNSDKTALCIANLGLAEYHFAAQDNTVFITLHRSVSEMGDWGLFQTEEAQMLHDLEFKLACFMPQLHERFTTYNRCRDHFVTLPYVQIAQNPQGTLAKNQQFLKLSAPDAYLSALKRNTDNTLIARMHGNGKATQFSLNHKYIRTNLLETRKEAIQNNKIGAYEIVSIMVENL